MVHHQSVLSEVYMEDKASNKILPNAAIVCQLKLSSLVLMSFSVTDLGKSRNPPSEQNRRPCTLMYYTHGESQKTDAAAKFMQASRPDLAEKEDREAEILAKFLPPLLSEAEVDRILTEIIESLPVGVEKAKSTGRIFKEFYLKADQSRVNPNVVKQRTAEMLATLDR